MTEKEPLSGGQAVARWWRRLHPTDTGTGGDRGAAAQLRRATTPAEALLLPQTIALYGQVREALGRAALSEDQTTAVATLAAVLAGVKPGKPGGPRFAAALGRTVKDRRPQENERARMSPMRFGALMRASGGEERQRQLRRAVDLLGDASFDVARFADDMLRWNDATRSRWIFDYYQEGAAVSPEPQGEINA